MLSDFYQKVITIYVKIMLNIKFHKILWFSSRIIWFVIIKCTIMICNNLYFAYNFFLRFHSIEAKTWCIILKILENYYYRTPFHAIMPPNFCHIHTDRHFLKMVKSCSGHLKTYKSIKNRKSKIFKNPILSSYIYRRKQ